MDCLERWFNIVVSPDIRSITDTKGRKFWIYWQNREITSSLHVRRFGKPEGRIDVTWETDHVVLKLIKVNNPKYRGCGVGAAMMQEFKNQALSRGAKKIVGKIFVNNQVRLEGVTEAYVFNWYKYQGFEVGPEGDLRLML